jgi:hypothetical protein
VWYESQNQHHRFRSLVRTNVDGTPASFLTLQRVKEFVDRERVRRSSLPFPPRCPDQRRLAWIGALGGVSGRVDRGRLGTGGEFPRLADLDADALDGVRQAVVRLAFEDGSRHLRGRRVIEDDHAVSVARPLESRHEWVARLDEKAVVSHLDDVGNGALVGHSSRRVRRPTTSTVTS